MTDKEKLDAIRAEIHRLVDVRGYDTEMANDLLTFMDSLPNEPASNDLIEATNDYGLNVRKGYPRIMDETDRYICNAFKAGAEWQKKHLWKNAQGDDLPTIDREVIALLNNGKVVFAHRPYKGKYIGKSLTTGNIETFENKTYDKGEWNIPDVMYWLDCEMPKQMKVIIFDNSDIKPKEATTVYTCEHCPHAGNLMCCHNCPNF